MLSLVWPWQKAARPLHNFPSEHVGAGQDAKAAKSLNHDYLKKCLPPQPSWQVLSLFSGLGADAECSHTELSMREFTAPTGWSLLTAQRRVAPSCRQWLRASHEAVSTGVMSIHLGKCFPFLSAVQVVYVLLNKVHVPYANECTLEWWYTDTLYVKYVWHLKIQARTKNHL